jgi:glycosyltransferase involved in cell wall biosynthesis
MKLLCINYEYPPIGGGGGVACRGLAEALVNMGYHIDVVTAGMKDLPTYENIEGVNIHRVKCIRRFRHYATLPEMLTMILPLYYKALELVRNGKYHLNHTHFIVPSGIVSYLLWKKTGLPYLIISHGSDVPDYNTDRFYLTHKLIKFMWQRVVTHSEGLITPSIFLKQLVKKRIDAPIEVIPYGCDLTQNKKQKKKNCILVVTRMFERKGVQFFLKAVSNLNTDWEILIVGDGPYLPALKAIGRNVPSVRFLGYVQGEELMELYQSSKIFVFPSVQENFPVVLLEAMAAGCAIITTTACGCAEVVGDAGIKTECGSVTGIRNALEYLMQNEHETERLARAAYDRVTDLAWPKIAYRYDRISNQCRYN